MRFFAVQIEHKTQLWSAIFFFDTGTDFTLVYTTSTNIQSNDSFLWHGVGIIQPNKFEMPDTYSLVS